MVLAASMPLHAADNYPTFLNKVSAGPDLAVQGEYVATVGKSYRIGIQIIAMGNGTFEGVAHGGGLPGAGWDRMTRLYLRGRRNGHVTRLHGVHGERLAFPNDNIRCEIKDGQLKGQALAFLKKAGSADLSGHRVQRASPTLGARPPRDARVLFNGSNTNAWVDGQIDDMGLLVEGTRSKREFGNYRLHLEFRTPFMPTARGMHRGNSGVYLQELWEIQVVDSFGWTTENRKYERLSHVGRCGGIHELVMPQVNMCLPPLAWQTYDVEHRLGSVGADGKQRTPAVLSVRHNGVLIHDQFILPPTPASQNRLPHRNHLPGRLLLQQHGNPVRYRNIWIVEIKP